MAGASRTAGQQTRPAHVLETNVHAFPILAAIQHHSVPVDWAMGMERWKTEQSRGCSRGSHLHGGHVWRRGVAGEVQAHQAAAQLGQPAQQHRKVRQHIVVEPQLLSH